MHLPPDSPANREPLPATAAELRSFGQVVGGAFGGLAAILWWREQQVAPVVLGIVAVVLVLSGMVAPATLRGVHRGWMSLSHRLNAITGPIFLGVIYFGILTPTGLIRRAFGWRAFRRSPTGSAWVRRAPGDRASALDRQF